MIDAAEVVEVGVLEEWMAIESVHQYVEGCECREAGQGEDQAGGSYELLDLLEQ